MSTHGLSVLLLMQLTGVHIDTARRWKRQGRIPAHYETIAQLRLSGDLGAITGSWKGFKIADGKLWTPEGQPVAPGDVRSIPYRAQEISELRRQPAEPKQRELF